MSDDDLQPRNDFTKKQQKNEINTPLPAFSWSMTSVRSDL